MEQEIKQEQPTQELEDQKVETVSGGAKITLEPDHGPQKRDGIIYFM